MGSICCIYSDYERWEETSDKKTTKSNENVTKYIIGHHINDFQAQYDIEIYIRDSIYEKIKNKEYLVDKETNPSRTLIIKDKAGNKIEPLLKDYCY